jgi:hypothetical protein
VQLEYIGKTLLGYPTKEVWQMTLRHLMRLYDCYCVSNGIERKKQTTIDDVIPE